MDIIDARSLALLRLLEEVDRDKLGREDIDICGFRFYSFDVCAWIRFISQQLNFTVGLYLNTLADIASCCCFWRRSARSRLSSISTCALWITDRLLASLYNIPLQTCTCRKRRWKRLDDRKELLRLDCGRVFTVVHDQISKLFLNVLSHLLQIVNDGFRLCQEFLQCKIWASFLLG